MENDTTQATESAKPTMSAKQASFHVAVAGAQARQEALKQGADEGAIDTLMSMGDTLKIGDMVMKPYSVATFWALQAVGSKLIKDPAKTEETIAVGPRDVILAAMCFGEPKNVWQKCRAGKLEELQDRAFELAEMMSMEDITRLNGFMEAEFAKLGGKEDTDPLARSPSPSAANGSSMKSMTTAEAPAGSSTTSMPSAASIT